jgi:3-oxoacyl-[acyl-carrier-protein] synthase III
MYKMPIQKVIISDLSTYLPAQIVTNADIEKWVTLPALQLAGMSAYEPEKVKALEPGTLNRIFGTRERRYAAPGENASAIGAAAALPIVERKGRNNIDCMIFASASSDMIEPATANMAQEILGLGCPVFDIKNACNSAITALHVATSLIQSGAMRNVLIVTGEKPQDCVKFNLDNSDELKKRLSSYTLGDIGVAMLVELSPDLNRGIILQQMESRGEHWRLCQIPGGGSAFPHADMNYFEGKTADLRDAFLKEFLGTFIDFFTRTGWQPADVKHIFMHQVSMGTFSFTAQAFGLPLDLFRHSFAQYGNIASASIPVNLCEAVSSGALLPGDKVLILGLGAGISFNLTAMVW